MSIVHHMTPATTKALAALILFAKAQPGENVLYNENGEIIAEKDAVIAEVEAALAPQPTEVQPVATDTAIAAAARSELLSKTPEQVPLGKGDAWEDGFISGAKYFAYPPLPDVARLVEAGDAMKNFMVRCGMYGSDGEPTGVDEVIEAWDAAKSSLPTPPRTLTVEQVVEECQRCYTDGLSDKRGWSVYRDDLIIRLTTKANTH
jgi:hypothetical protein